MSTPIEALAQESAERWQNKGCVEGQPIFENARTRWAATDYKAGFLDGAKAASGQGEARIKVLENCLKRIYRALENNEVISNGGPTHWQILALLGEALSGAGKGE